MLRLTPRPAAGRPEARSSGWRTVGVLAVTETVSWGVLFYAFSVVLVPMGEDLGVGRGVLAGAWSLALLVSGVAAPFVGSWIDRGGGRVVMTAGAVLGPFGVWWWSSATSLPTLYAAFALIGIASAMVLYEPAFAVVAAVVEDRDRARALLVVTVVAGFAATIFLPLTAALEAAVGWRGSLRWLAVLLLVTTAVPHAVVVPRRPPDVGRDAARTAATRSARRGRGCSGIGAVLHDRAFWWLTAAFVLGTASITAVSAHLVAFLTDRGETATFAAVAVGALGAIKVGGRIVLALAERRAAMAALTAGVFASQGLALVVLAVTSGRLAILAFVLVYGAGFGAATIARPLLVLERWGSSSYGAIAGVLAAVVTVAKAVAPVAAGVARDAAGSSTPVLVALGAVTAAAGLCLVPLVRVRPAVPTSPVVAGLTRRRTRSGRRRRPAAPDHGRAASSAAG